MYRDFFMPFISIHNKQIHYEVINPASTSNEVLIFLHEALGSIPQWKDFPEKLCKNINCKGLVYERLGYGQSDDNPNVRNEKYLEEAAKKELDQFIRLCTNKNDRIHLIGHSDGGSIALVYAGISNRIASVTTMAAHIFVEEVTLNGIQPAIKAYEQGKLNGLKKYHGVKTEKLFYDWAHTWLADFFKEWNIESYLKHISCPVFVIQGVEDQYGTVQQVDGIVNQVRGKARKLMIPECGHAPHLEKKDVVLAVIENFIKDDVL